MGWKVEVCCFLRGGGLGVMPLLFMKDSSCSGISAKVSLACKMVKSLDKS